jgi:hypothetical protein
MSAGLMNAQKTDVFTYLFTCCELQQFDGCFLSQIHGENEPTRLNLAQSLMCKPSLFALLFILPISVGIRKKLKSRTSRRAEKAEIQTGQQLYQNGPK